MELCWEGFLIKFAQIFIICKNLHSLHFYLLLPELLIYAISFYHIESHINQKIAARRFRRLNMKRRQNKTAKIKKLKFFPKPPFLLKK